MSKNRKNYLEETPGNGEKNTSKKSGSKTALIIICCVLAAILIGVSVYLVLQMTGETLPGNSEVADENLDAILNIEVFHEGVTIDGIDVTGLTKDQARAYIEEAQQERLEEIHFTLTLSEEAKTALAQQEAKELAEAQALEEQAEEASEAAEQSTDQEVDEQESNEAIDEATEAEETVEDTEQDAQEIAPDENGNFYLTKEHFNVTFNTDEVIDQAFSLAKEGTYEDLMEEIEDIRTNGREFATEYTLEANENLDAFLNQVAEICNIEPQDATVTFKQDSSAEERFEYVPEVAGIALDLDALKQEINTAAEAKAFETPIEMPTTATQPEVTVDSLKGTITLRASATTSFAGSNYGYADRVFNITKASGLINGKVVQPGEVFSMNDTIGDRTYALGWKPGGAISGGETVKQAGGGVCQVSTTLYNAVVKSDLEIVYRQAHSQQLGYVDGGLDATINTGTIDFKWKNNTNSPVIIVSYIDGYTINVEIYGEPFSGDFDEIRLTSKKIATIQPNGEMKYTVDTSKSKSYKEVKIKRRSGSKWQSYKNYYKDDGTLLRSEPLAISVYKAYAGETIVGEAPDASPSASVEPSEKATKTKKPEATKTKKPEATKTKKPEATKTTAPTPTPTEAPTPTPTPTEAPTPTPTEE